MKKKSPLKGWGVALKIGASLLGAYSAYKGRKQARRQFRAAQEERRAQMEILEQEKQAYRDFQITNPFANMDNPFSSLQTDFQPLQTGRSFQNVFAGGENPFEDLTVNQQQAQFQAQQGARQRANILSGLREAAGGSGIAPLAQTLANQGALQAQQISASIGQQEAQNQRLQAQGAMDLQRQEMLGASEQQKLAFQQDQINLRAAERARALGIDRENLLAQMQLKTDLAEREGDRMVQEAEMSRLATILGSTMGTAAGAQQAEQMSAYNRASQNQASNQMFVSALTGLADSGIFGEG